jgi:hypothetical protein
MCDTFASLGNAAENQKSIFAKNSDRDPNEPQIFVHIPKSEDVPSSIRTTYIEIEGYRRDYDILLSQPSWLWGGEIGVNSAGVAIGNEAVFTKMPYRKTGLTGMDILRIALERSGTALDAVAHIISYLEKYHQGGNCSYDGKLLYHNAFLVTDGKEGYLLETADDIWAYKKIKSFGATSNRLTISTDYLRASSLLNGRSIDFSETYTDSLISFFTGSAGRLSSSCAFLSSENAKNRETMIELLSSRPTGKVSSMRNIGMNAGGGLVNSQTTASAVVEFGGRPLLWYTMSPCPEIALFKPAWFIPSSPLSERNREQLLRRWKYNNHLFREVMKSYEENCEEIADLRQRTQEEIFSLADAVASDDSDDLRESVMSEALEIEDEYRSCVLGMVRGNSSPGALFRNLYWRRQKKLLLSKEKDPEIIALYKS